MKTTEILTPNKSTKLGPNCSPEKNRNKHFADVVEKGGSKKVQKNSCRNVENEQEQNNLSSGETITQTSKKDVTKENIQKIQGEKDSKNMSPKIIVSDDFEYDFYKIKSVDSYKVSSNSNGSIVPEKDLKLEFVDTLTRDEIEERINLILAILAGIVQILIILPLFVGILSSLPGIPTEVQPRIPVERTSKLKFFL